MPSSRSKKTPKNLSGQLLLAHPGLRDPNFRRAVVLMSAHSDEGAMGVVLNRPMGKKLGDLNGSFAYGPLANIPVYLGGPVQEEQLLLIAWQMRDDGFRVHFGVEPEQAAQLLEETGTEMRAFVGYSGWSAGQLENEMEHNTWVSMPLPEDFLERLQNEGLWKQLIGNLGSDWKLLANEPDDLSLN